jgi:hypothetical protein
MMTTAPRTRIIFVPIDMAASTLSSGDDMDAAGSLSRETPLSGIDRAERGSH